MKKNGIVIYGSNFEYQRKMFILKMKNLEICLWCKIRVYGHRNIKWIKAGLNKDGLYFMKNKLLM